MRKIGGEKMSKDGAMMKGPFTAGDVIYPHFSIETEYLPEAKDWKIGKTYDVTLRVRQTGISMHKHEGQNKEYGRADFEIVGIEPHGEKGAKKARYTEND